jgi:hypothetical protein
MMQFEMDRLGASESAAIIDEARDGGHVPSKSGPARARACPVQVTGRPPGRGGGGRGSAGGRPCIDRRRADAGPILSMLRLIWTRRARAISDARGGIPTDCILFAPFANDWKRNRY